VTLTKAEHQMLTELSNREEPYPVEELDNSRYPDMKALGRLRLIDAHWPVGSALPLEIWITEFGRNVLKDINVESEKDS